MESIHCTRNMFAMERETIVACGGTVEDVRSGVGGSWRETKVLGVKKAV
jgi:hypothetical protein